MQENVAEIIAWLAIIAASVATTKTGQKRLSVVFTAQGSNIRKRSIRLSTLEREIGERKNSRATVVSERVKQSEEQDNLTRKQT